jgi:hypothetical protein
LFWNRQNVNKKNSGEKNFIFEVVWPGASPTQKKATAIKLGHYKGLIADDWTCLLKNINF